MPATQTADDTLVRVGQYIKQRRESLGLTQNELAEMIKNFGYDIDSPAIARIENGRGGYAHLGNPKFTTALSQTLRVSRSRLAFILGHIANLTEDERMERMAEMFATLPTTEQDIVESMIEMLFTKHNTKS